MPLASRFDVESNLPNERLLFRPVRVPDARLANAALASGNKKDSVICWLYKKAVLLRGSEIEPDDRLEKLAQKRLVRLAVIGKR